jgi:hypothetical protein
MTMPTQTIQEYIEGTMQANCKKVMQGDEAVPVKTAVTIALEAVNMAAKSVTAATMAQKRFEIGCHVAGHVWAILWHDDESKPDGWEPKDCVSESCGIAENIVTEMFDRVFRQDDAEEKEDAPN